MKFSVNIGNRKVLMSYEHLEKLESLLTNVEFIDEKWVGSGNGTTGSNNGYLLVVEPFSVQEHLSVSIVSDEKVEAIKFVQKQQEKSA